ncbi:MAG: B12-binding domain-containing radical SAM protein [Lachnospiraceae bacterium]|nr:B12-binding domain-containing radical SAM protein [Lachnospiraceae bacterium]
MRFLLVAVNAKYIHSNPAIYSLRAYAGDELRPYIDLAEYTINQQMQDILADIYSKAPDAVGFSCYIWNWGMIRRLIVELKKLLPETDIWLGGPEVSYDAPEILREFPQVRGVMVGEGEETFRELVQWYVGGQSGGASGEMFAKQPVELSDQSVGRQRQQADIAGLCLPTGYTKPRALTDLSRIPFLYENLDSFSNKILYYESSRGCPYRCSYCLSSIDKKVRLRDMEIVKRELQFFLDHKVKQVKFIDRTFNCDHAHAMGIWQYIYEHDNGVTNFHFEISADILREDEIALLNRFRPGLAQLEIGVQTTNVATIKAIDRVMDVEKLERIVSAVHEGRNIHQHLDLIAGLPFEDYDSFARSFNRVYAMQPDQLQLGFLKVLKGSPMEQRAQEYGIVYLSEPPYEVLYTKWLPYEQVLRLKRIEEMVELYYNSDQFTATLPFLEQVFETPFVLYETLADYYEEKGYFVQNPARSYRYQILLEFALKYDADHEHCYRELLTFDIYLRENAKSRPDFAEDTREEGEIKEFIREFYRSEEENHVYLPAYEGYDWKQLSRMTHLEPFVYPVWDAQKMRVIHSNWVNQTKQINQTNRVNVADQSQQTKGYREVYFVLFDYQKRNPLNYEAGVRIISMENESMITDQIETK